MCNRCMESINEIEKHKGNTRELIIEHIEEIEIVGARSPRK